MSHQTDFCILGAGIAGLSLADALQEKDFSTAVIDKNPIASSASGTPGGLVNPATGRRAKKSWKAELCYEAIAANLEKVQAKTEENFYRDNGLLRPALLEKMARKMKDQHEKTTWPEGWCQWKSEGEIKEIHPGIECIDGGLWLPIGLTVDVGKYMKAYSRYLDRRKINIFLNEEPKSIRKDNNNWQVDLADKTLYAKNLVFAIGHHTTESEYWDWLPLNLIKGQVARFRSEKGPLSFDHSISSLGYMARTGGSNTFVQGSTYEHDFEHLHPDSGGEDYLRKRMRRTLPKLEKNVSVVDQWAGVRTSTPNYKPILGKHPEYENLHLFTALGSKGLLYGKFLAEHYANHLTTEDEIYEEVSIKRFDTMDA